MTLWHALLIGLWHGFMAQVYCMIYDGNFMAQVYGMIYDGNFMAQVYGMTL